MSCSNLEAGNLTQPKSTPQLPLAQATTILPSPDGKWVAYFFGLDQIDYKLSIANFEDTIVWNINQKNYGGESWLVPYRWSEDSRYLYFNIYASISFSEDQSIPFYQGMGLQRLDVQNGQVSEILPSGYFVTLDSGGTIFNWYLVKFSLSPEEDKLAYMNILENGVQLVIRNMKTDKEEEIFFDNYENAGRILWSPKQDYLVFGASKNAVGFIELVKLDSLTTKRIHRNTNQVIIPLMWLNQHTIFVKEFGGSYFYLDIMSEELSPAPQSPQFPD